MSEELHYIFFAHFLTNFREHLSKLLVWDESISIFIQHIEGNFELLFRVLQLSAGHEFGQNGEELVKLDRSIFIHVWAWNQIVNFLLGDFYTHRSEEVQDFLENETSVFVLVDWGEHLFEQRDMLVAQVRVETGHLLLFLIV